MARERTYQTPFHPEAESFRYEMPLPAVRKAFVTVEFTKPLPGDVTSHIVYEVSKQGRPGFGHPLDVVIRDIMATPDLPVTPGKQRTFLGDAAIAETHVFDSEQRKVRR